MDAPPLVRKIYSVLGSPPPTMVVTPRRSGSYADLAAQTVRLHPGWTAQTIAARRDYGLLLHEMTTSSRREGPPDR